ncbi:GNAT family N-acetyltransferase [Nocardia sp. BMG51109]|uniref:GNAT family N-acetyltransferase n=1 Tax=Nocardia sp. BMG51109 TaxID=1056816 RepID=UPI00046613AB|nr:GNAT family protein [Nocardia sp. BMG51109]
MRGALPYPDPPLSDGVVLLRPWRESDLGQRFAGFSDPLCLRFSWPLVRPLTEADVVARFAAEEFAREGGHELSLAVADAGDPDRVWGGTSVYDTGFDEGRAGIGYWLTAAARGRGVASRTVRLLAGWSFARLSVQRLELTCAPDNTASQRVAERCGFVREGVLRAHLPFRGRRRDSVLYSLLPGDPV